MPETTKQSWACKHRVISVSANVPLGEIRDMKDSILSFSTKTHRFKQLTIIEEQNKRDKR